MADLSLQSTACIVHKASVKILDPVNLHTKSQCGDNGEALLAMTGLPSPRYHEHAL